MEEEMGGCSIPTPSLVECDSFREPSTGTTCYSLIDYPCMRLLKAPRGSIRPALAIVNEHVGVHMYMCVHACAAPLTSFLS